MLLEAGVKERILKEIYRILDEIGFKVENDVVKKSMLKTGCLEKSKDRMSIPKQVITEIVSKQKKTQAEDAAVQELSYNCNIDWTHAILWRNQIETMKEKLKSNFLISAFDCGPTKYYDYPTGKTVNVDTKIFIEMKKLAQATPEIGYVANWYRNDAHPKLERLESLILAFQYTDKSAGVEAIYPEVIKYLKDASDIISGDSGAATGTYLAGSQCITPPLFLEDRSAQDILERKKCGINKYHVTSMGALSMSLPITLAGAIAVSVAELLGGVAAVYSIEPEANVTARMIANTIDMKTLQPSCAGPEVPLINMGVKELFDEFFGGHCWVDVFFAPAVNNPGLRAVYEYFYGSMARAKLANKPHIPYIGVGTLGNGAVGSPTQLMLDIEIRKSQSLLNQSIKADKDDLAFDTIASVIRGNKDFLDTDHTLTRFRKLWRSEIFSATINEATNEMETTEKDILDRCDQSWRDNIKNNYNYPGLDSDKLKELNKVVERAKKEFLD